MPESLLAQVGVTVVDPDGWSQRVSTSLAGEFAGADAGDTPMKSESLGPVLTDKAMEPFTVERVEPGQKPFIRDFHLLDRDGPRLVDPGDRLSDLAIFVGTEVKDVHFASAFLHCEHDGVKAVLDV